MLSVDGSLDVEGIVTVYNVRNASMEGQHPPTGGAKCLRFSIAMGIICIVNRVQGIRL